MKTLALSIGTLALLLTLGLGSPAQACPACGCEDAPAPAPKQAAAPSAFDSAPAVGTAATCPVMGSKFKVTADSPRSEYKGKHYAFCCTACKPKFDQSPEKYAK